jgi:hypothetical protein
MNPVFEFVGEMPYPSVQTLFDGLMPPGMQWYWRADFFNLKEFLTACCGVKRGKFENLRFS